MKTAIILGVLAIVLAGPATSAPVAPLADVAVAPVERAQWRGGNWHDHPLMYRGNWERHQRQWDAIEGHGADSRSPACARLRSYDPASHTYVNRNGRRLRCP